MKTAIYALSALAIILGVMAAALWSRPTPVTPESDRNIKFGLYEGRELVGMVDKHGNTAYIVEDGHGKKLFNIPVRNCVLDVRFRNGQLRFRENNTGREGYIDRDGIVTSRVTAACCQARMSIKDVSYCLPTMAEANRPLTCGYLQALGTFSRKGMD